MGQHVRLAINEIRGGVATAFRLVTRYIDILFAPFILEAAMLIAYLVARGVSMCIPLTLGGLGRKAAPQMARLSQLPKQTLFQAAAARVNLGYLMVCGAVSLLVLASAPFLSQSFGGLDSAFDEMLIWLVVGQAAPVLFGATALLMRAVDRGAFYDVLQGVTAAMFLGALAVFDGASGVMMAQTLAAAQLTLAALSALLLTQCGIWPGLTALFHKQIKLF